MSVLLELAAKCEQATGPDRELDIAIWRTVNPVHANIVDSWARDGKGDEPPAEWLHPFTASLDAAMTLVPEGWLAIKCEQHWRTAEWAVQLAPKPSEKLIAAFNEGRTVGYNTADAKHATSQALALCAAALRARAAQEQSA